MVAGDYSAVIDPVQSSIARPFHNSEKPVLPDFTGHYTEAFQKFDFRRFWHSLSSALDCRLCVLAGLFLALGYWRARRSYQGHTVLEVEFQEPSSFLR